jgi:hypothetical protein
MVDRVLRAIRLDWTVFREIAEDESALMEAAIIVVVASFLSAIGSGIAAERFVGAFFASWIVSVLVGWIGWAVITYFVGTTMFEGDADVSEMMRVLGYAYAPNVLGFFSFIPCVGWLVAFIGGILSLIAAVFAIREAMEFETGNAVVTIVIGWIVVFVISLIVGLVVGGGMLVASGIFK